MHDSPRADATQAQQLNIAVGLDVLALRTPTLPPATHTNTSLVGREQVWVVDPATPYDTERTALLAAVDTIRLDGRTVAGIILTHHHHDHVGAAAWLSEQRGLPILAHPRTAVLLDGQLTLSDTLEDGDTLVCSEASNDTWHVLHTPGHASDHIVLWEPVRRLLIGGDMVAQVGTIVIVPPDGHMATYIAQLQRLIALDPALIVPAHGGVIEDAVAHLEHYVSHRLAREAQVLDVLTEMPRALGDVTREAYPELPRFLLPLAERSAEAHLIKLQEDGVAAQTDTSRWHRAV
ncbi:MAG: ribonuclease/clavin/mitogillin [Myxococcota bacterium]|jgi:ribonuclease/clavin/mitogillin